MEKEQWYAVLQSIQELFSNLGGNSFDESTSYRFTKSEYEEINQLILNQRNLNGWFTDENVRKSMLELSKMLDPNDVIQWASNYTYSTCPKKILIIMAGNLPLVGFHDLICVWLSGNKALIKLSSDDNTLLPKILDWLTKLHPDLIDFYSFDKTEIKNCDAVIATGSDNSNLYFEKYFGHLPCLFRRNRTSIAILEGTESKDELELLGQDIFDYFGKGCRNVSFLLIPYDFDLNRLFEAIISHGDIINHKKYGNNYDYNRAILLMNQKPFLDNNFSLFVESDSIFSSISILHYRRYKCKDEIEEFISKNEKSIQIIVGSDFTPFGSSQNPRLFDYADGIDTVDWLNSLS
jgi:hypothetical protein